MIITVETPLVDLMVKLKCDPALITQVELSGLQVDYLPNGIKVFILDKGKTFEHIAPIKLGVLNAIITDEIKDTNGPTYILARTGLEQAVKLVFTAAGMQPKLEPNLEPKLVGIVDMVFENITKHTLPSLKDATELLEPVHGTTTSTKYWVVAVGNGLNVAARLKSKDGISVRVEGTLLAHHKSQLEKLGFEDNGTHCSIHYAAPSNEIAKKSVGALIFGIEHNFNKVHTNMSSLWGI